MGKVRTTQEMNDAAEIGLKISRLRVSRHMTQEELAEKIGVDRVTVFRMENGKRIPDVTTIIALSDALSVAPGEFFPARLIKKSAEKPTGFALNRLIDRMSEPDKDLFCAFVMKAATAFIH